MRTLKRLSRLYPQELTEHMIYLPRVSPEQLADQAAMQTWLEAFQERLRASEKSGLTYSASLREDRERHLWLPEVEQVAHGLSHYITFNRDFFASNDYKLVTALGDQLNNLLEEDAFVQRGERRKAISSFKEALGWLMTESTKRHTIQRYKGLGEMNPEQLWETTMDPNVRRMLKVTIEDAIGADQIFNTLMGDAVEPVATSSRAMPWRCPTSTSESGSGMARRRSPGMSGVLLDWKEGRRDERCRSECSAQRRGDRRLHAAAGAFGKGESGGASRPDGEAIPDGGERQDHSLLQRPGLEIPQGLARSERSLCTFSRDFLLLLKAPPIGAFSDSKWHKAGI